MNLRIACAVLLVLQISITAQTKIPEIIKTDMTIKALPKYYESTGFIVDKGATLTIMPGAKIRITPVKDKDPIIRINGNLIIGQGSNGKNQPVIIDGDCPGIVFTDATIDLNNLELNVPQVLFNGQTKGSVKTCKFLTGPTGVWYKVLVNVPKTGSLTFNDTLFEDKSVEITSNDFPSDLDRLTFNKCAFTTKYSTTEHKNNLHLMPIMALAYGSKCDCHINIEFKQFDWLLKKPLKSEWYFSDEKLRKSVGDSAQLLKTYELKLATKAFTIYKQDETPEVKKNQK